MYTIFMLLFFNIGGNGPVCYYQEMLRTHTDDILVDIQAIFATEFAGKS